MTVAQAQSLRLNHLMLLCYNNHIGNCAKKYVDAIEQNASSRQVSGLSGGGGTGRKRRGVDGSST